MANDNDEVKGPKTKPLRKTSAVPLRKETVRVTLKATPAGAGSAPRPPAPAPPKPPSVATTPLETTPIDEPTPAPSADKGVDLPDVTSAVPLRQETMRVTLKANTGGAPMAPAPTVPLGNTPSAPAAPSAPAPTIPLGSSPSVPQPAAPAPTVPLGGAAATVPLATQPLGGGTGSSQPLPKATVQLQQTQQLSPLGGGAPVMPTIQTIGDDEPVKGEGMTNVLAIAAFVVALAALGTTLMHANHWIEEHKEGSWEALMNTGDADFPNKRTAGEYIYKGK